MWPFSRKTERDEVLGNVNRGVLAAIGALNQQVITLRTEMKLLDENSAAARGMEKHLARIDAQSSATRGLLEDHVSRLDQAIVTLRGQMTGGRGGRPRSGDPVAADIGRALVETLGPERAAQLANEVVDRHNVSNGTASGGSPDAVFA